MSTLNTADTALLRGRIDAPGLATRLAQIPLIWKLLSVAIFALAWEMAGRSGFNFSFPTFSATVAAFWEMLVDGSMGMAYLRTMEPLAIGLAFSLIVGVTMGVAMGLREDVEWLALPIFIVMQAAPMAALIPLVTFIYGISLTAKVIAVVMLAMPVITINSYKAVRNVPGSLVSMCHSFMGNRRQQIWYVVMPAASPMMFAGLRLGVAEGFSGVVLAELLITPTGIGDLITFHRSVANFAHMYATIASIVLFAVIAVGLLQWVETLLFRPEKRSVK
ncbi:ABC transporter permease [Pelagibacterium halotolerans]|uniref:ABC transporter, permease component n=1 Tax=Pelagibacterium halotolerans (strain DSM 22347 / JCM 15775 / CGMCC 1.7692 / B2) TaxID=1082931 RepID=G4R7M9_PELHB|nr:ABC transporter permease subunit [Pelagibacterium halotolerans]AEQ53289.1 ABC transporter, permease component [Pelagibacterium halotolerans B2]QJR17094.1 ABC transporter permease subunit [Pelagibacterium halotolerans]SEA99151.1 NitT/TauT family transport system permease protein [Pelagibacterium halotolerans]